MSKIRKAVDLSGIPEIDLDHIEIRAVTGEDSLDAASRCIPPDGTQLDMNVFGLMMRQQMIIQSIVRYTPRETKVEVVCAAPPVEVAHWSIRTRDFVGDVYDSVNGSTQKERDDFRATLSSTPGSRSDDGDKQTSLAR